MPDYQEVLQLSGRFTISIGSDHAGFQLKERLIKEFFTRDYGVINRGCFDPEPVDYPDIANRVTEDILAKRADLGILICGTGIGMSMAANRKRGIRAALVVNGFMAKSAREHNNANILIFPARIITYEMAIWMFDQWNNTRFQGGRHERRINKLDESGSI